MFHGHGQPLIQIIDFRFIHQIVDQCHQYFQLRAYVRHKERSEAANRHRDSVLYKSGQKLQEEYDFISGTDLSVEENEVARARQMPDCDILIGDDFSFAQRHNRAKIQSGSVHKYTTKDKQASRGFGPTNHKFASTRSRHVSPIILHAR